MINEDKNEPTLKVSPSFFFFFNKDEVVEVLKNGVVFLASLRVRS